LVVDDNEATTMVLRAMLSLDAHQPVVVYDGRSALAEVATGQIDLVLLDAGLPDMDGLEVCLRIKEAFPRRFLPVILLTARARRDERLAGLASGADDYITKPFDAEELLAKVRGLLRIKRVEDALLQRNRELASLNAVATLVNQSHRPDEIMPRVLDEMLPLFGFTQGAILTWERDSAQARLIAYRAQGESDAAEISLGSAFAVPPTLFGGAAGVAGAITAEPADLAWCAPLISPELPRRYLAPLWSQDVPRGFLLLAGPPPTPGAREQATLPVLRALSYQLAIALEHGALFTQEQRQREQSEAMVRKLTELDALKSQFISTASHEFRTPLSIIKGFANLLKRRVEFGFDSEAEHEYFDVIDLQIQALTQLIDNLLSVSRIESGRVPIQPRSIDLAALVSRATGLMALQAAQRSIAITVTDGPALWAHADPQHVEQVLLNLLSNALKYSDDGTHVRVSLGVQEAMAVVAVEDQGVGIPADQMSRLFEKFARLESRRTVEAGGTGLGLYIAKSAVEANGGRMWAESTPGVGSTFMFTLPLSAPPTAPTDGP